MSLKLKPQARIGFAVLAFLVLMLGAWKAGLFAVHAPTAQSAVPTDVNLVGSQDQAAAAVSAGSTRTFTMPSSTPVTTGTPIRYLGFAWNSQMGLHFANGGPVTTQGSLMAERGIKLTFTRQDDTSVQAAALVACARELSQGKPDCTSGAQFMAVMGDGTPSILRALNEALSQLPGQDLVAEVVGSAGYSRGEDKLMGPPEWIANAQSARGGVIAGVLKDGDWNIAMDWAGKNDICNNPDPTTYDPNCLNWVATTTYLEPVEKYNASACESRPVVRDGHRTSDTKTDVCVQGVVTWTPGDVNVAHGRGGLLSVLSTRENSTQMPNAIIGIRRWNRAHEDVVVKFIEAIGLGGEAVNTDPRALSFASAVSDAAYHEANTGPLYWETYFHGREEIDRVTHQKIVLGGSKANNLADMQALFGLLPGTVDAFSATYNSFGRIMHEQYPHDMPDFPAYGSIHDTRYIVAAAARSGTNEVAETPTFADAVPTDANTRVVASRSWTINFEVGKADFTPDTIETLNSLRDQLVVSSSMYVDLTGHTDNTGDPNFNRDLSKRRAQAVANWLHEQSPSAFPWTRMHVYGKGSDEPANPANTAAARAQNRRVAIVLRAQS